MIIHWFLPGFLRNQNRDGAHPARALALNNLPSLLAKADRFDSADAWTACAQLLGFSAFPFAQVAAVNSGFEPGEPWALLTPTAIQPEHRGIYLLGDRPLNLSEAERKQLREELHAWMSEDGLSLHSTLSEHWLLSLNKRNDFHSTPYLQVIGRDAMTVMPHGADALFWQAKLTEWQMIMQRSFINQQRQIAQQPVIQAAHLWGESAAHTPHSTRIKAVFTDSDAIAQWLTKCATAIRVFPLDQLPRHPFDEVAVIAVNGEPAWAYGDVTPWQHYWQTVDAFFNASPQQRIYPDNGFCYHAKPLQRFRIWRGKKNLPKEMQ